MQLDVKTLFKEGDKFYAMYSGVHDGEAVLSGVTKLHKVPVEQVKDFKEGTKIYFDKDGKMLEVKAPKTQKTSTRAAGTGCVGKPRDASMAKFTS